MLIKTITHILNTFYSFESVMLPRSLSGLDSKLLSMLVATLEGAVIVVLMTLELGCSIIYFFGGVFLMILIGDFLMTVTFLDWSGMI